MFLRVVFFYTEILSETGEKMAKNGPPNRLEFNSLPEPTKATVCQNRLAEPTRQTRITL